MYEASWIETCIRNVGPRIAWSKQFTAYLGETNINQFCKAVESQMRNNVCEIKVEAVRKGIKKWYLKWVLKYE